MAGKKKAGKIILISILSVIVLAVAAVGIYIGVVLGVIHQEIPDPTSTPDDVVIVETPRPDSKIVYQDGSEFNGYVLRSEFYSDDSYDEAPAVYSLLKEKYQETFLFCLSKMEAVDKDYNDITFFEEEVLLNLTVPFGMDAAKCFVYTVDEDGTLHEIEATEKEPFLVVRTQTLGLYLITEHEIEMHIHSFDEYRFIDDDTHAAVCECGLEEISGHVWDDGVVTTEATHLHDGVLTYTCICGFKRTEVIPQILDHTMSDWTAVDGITHTRSCECGLEETEDHTWDDGAVTLEATHLADGTFTYTCTKCGEIKTEVIQKITTHSFGEWAKIDDATHRRICECGEYEDEAHTWDDGVVTVTPTYVSEGEIFFTCTKCSAEKTEVLEPSAHTHQYTPWTKVDEENHTCECELCFDVKTEAHVWDDGVVTTEATHLQDGVLTYTCTKCSATKTKVIPKITEHTYTEWTKTDDTNHTRSCECGDVQTEKHTWNDGVVTKAATHMATGTKTYTCTKCSATKTEEIAKIATHTYKSWTKLDTAQHKGTCECGAVLEENHTWNSGKVTTAATHLKEGVKTYTCTKCSATKTEVVAKIATHTYTNWVKVNDTTHHGVCACGAETDENHTWDKGKTITAATHLTEGEMLYTCTKCSAQKTAVIAKLTTHTYTNWVMVDATKHHGVCACGAETDENHVWDAGVTTLAATFTTTGLKTYTCKKCPAQKTEVIQPIPTPAPTLSPSNRKNVLNIMLFGVDSGRTASSSITDFSGRTDSMMLLSIDLDNNEMYLTSFMRDLMVTYYNSSNQSTSRIGKLTEAFSRYGVNGAINTIQRYFDIKIDYYACVNFAGMKQILNKLGSIEMELTLSEAQNIFGEGAKAGKYELDATGAFTYMGIRKIDSDRNRNLRQGKVLQAYLNKFYTTPIGDLLSLLNECLQYVRTNMPATTITKVATAVYNGRAFGFSHSSYPTKYSSYSSYVVCKSSTCLGRCTITARDSNGTVSEYTCTKCGTVYKRNSSGLFGLSDMGYLCFEQNKQLDMDWFHKRVLNYGKK